MQRLRTVTSLDVSAVAGHHAMPAALLFPVYDDVLLGTSFMYRGSPLCILFLPFIQRGTIFVTSCMYMFYLCSFMY